MRRHPRVRSIVLGTLGALMIISGVLGAISSADDSSKLQELRAAGGSSERGTYVDAETDIRENAPGLPDKVRYCPRYSYTADDGVERTIIDRDSCVSNKSQLAGKTVKLLVDPSNPSTAFVDEDSASVGRTSSAILSWVMLAGGVALVIAALILALKSRRAAGEQESYVPKH